MEKQRRVEKYAFELVFCDCLFCEFPEKSGVKLIAELKTDEFGDFKYDDCSKSAYTVTIEADGYETVELEADCTDGDVVFDDVLVVAQTV